MRRVVLRTARDIVNEASPAGSSRKSVKLRPPMLPEPGHNASPIKRFDSLVKEAQEPLLGSSERRFLKYYLAGALLTGAGIFADQRINTAFTYHGKKTKFLHQSGLYERTFPRKGGWVHTDLDYTIEWEWLGIMMASCFISAPLYVWMRFDGAGVYWYKQRYHEPQLPEKMRYSFRGNDLLEKQRAEIKDWLDTCPVMGVYDSEKELDA